MSIWNFQGTEQTSRFEKNIPDLQTPLCDLSCLWRRFLMVFGREKNLRVIRIFVGFIQNHFVIGITWRSNLHRKWHILTCFFFSTWTLFQEGWVQSATPKASSCATLWTHAKRFAVRKGDSRIWRLKKYSVTVMINKGLYKWGFQDVSSIYIYRYISNYVYIYIHTLVGGWTTHLTNMLCKLDHFFKDRVEHKHIWNHHLVKNQPAQSYFIQRRKKYVCKGIGLIWQITLLH